MQRCVRCTQVLVNIPTCRRCVNGELNECKSSSDRKAKEQASEKAQFDLQIKTLQTSTTLRIDELQWQHEVRVEDLVSRLTFLRLQFENESADSVPKGDVVILVQGREDAPLYAHKLILASKSPVFCRMFQSEMSEGETGMIRIDDSTLPVMHAVIKFFYCAEMNFTDEVSAEDVLAVALKYRVDLLQTICVKHLIKIIDTAILSKILMLARKFHSEMFQKEMSIRMTRPDDTTLPLIHALIMFFYCGGVNFADEVSAEDVLAFAHKYSVDLLQTICEEYLIKTIDKVNLSKTLKLARKFDAKKLEAGALAFLKNHFDEFAGVIELS